MSQDLIIPFGKIFFLLLQKSHTLLKPTVGHVSHPTQLRDSVFQSWRTELSAVCDMHSTHVSTDEISD